MRVGMLTGGGDCPGLNAVIRAAVRKGIFHHGDEFLGFMEGWRGVLDDVTMPLTLETTSGILHRGGTILRSSRTNVKKIQGGFEQCAKILKSHDLDALIAMGGDDTQSISLALSERGVNCVGVPKTIDNDLSGTDACFGFDTAVSIATEAVDRLHSTAEAHNRVIVVEVMGRDAGWIALTTGIAGGADVTLVPERPIDMDEVCRLITYRREHGKKFSIVVVAERRQAARAHRPNLRRHLHRLLWPRPPQRHRPGPRRGDRKAHRLRDPQRQPRTYPARRHAHRVRPHARHPLRCCRH